MSLPRINPNRFPGGSNAHFILICITSFMVSFWAGRYLPIPDDFLPSVDWRNLAYHNPISGNGLTGIVICVCVATFLFLSHARRQRHAFGEMDELPSHDCLASLVGSLASDMDVRIDRLLVDRDIANADALAFGFLRRTILAGKRLRLMSVVAPSECRARMAHEIAHFRNGDVVYAFLSRALVQANLLLISMVFVWILAQPLAKVISDYLTWSYCPPMDPLCPLLSSRHRFVDFLAVQGSRQLPYYKQTVLSGLIDAAPTAVFWVLLLFLEHRSLLRVREVLADAQAAKLVGPKLMEETLAKGLSSSSVRELLCLPFSAHPSVAERVRLISCPAEVAVPTSFRFLLLGLVYSMASQLLSENNNSIIDLNARFGTMFMLADPHDFKSWIVVAWDALVFAILPFPILAALLRLNVSCVVSEASSSITLRRILTAVVVTSLGVIIGDAALPLIQFGLSLLVAGRPIANSILVRLISVSRLSEVVQLAIVLLLVAALYWIQLRLIVRGARSTSIPAILWGIFMVATYYAVWIVVRAIDLAAGDWANGQYYLVAAGICIAMYFSVMGLIIVRFKGRVSPSASGKQLAPWLFQV
jgi:Peptidase family M48